MLPQLLSEQVLEDCLIALAILESEENEHKWRVHWVGAVALIRTVGHVLHKVDTKSYPEIAETVSNASENWNSSASEHEIFREFINDERNNVLKEYQSSVHPTGTIKLMVEGQKIAYSEDAAGNIRDIEILDDNLFKPRLDGYGAGEDVRDIYKQAIQWWRIELAKIKS